ncbi:MAG: tRNA 2-thiouridine(34) synthase MnmA [Thermodesulfobacteria bacterium]|nr:tRNA 2-thiouridine(34) synthase MnmA [Thermodesulfobacteriota bacterium]
MKQSALVLASGGVDSTVTAHLLKSQGLEVQGLFLKMTLIPQEEAALEAARALFHRLGLELIVKDVSERFRQEIVDYFLRSYMSGQTPNCCCICNWEIKMKTALEVADSLGIPFVATGHYARVLHCKRPLLLRGQDMGKDQSYFLHRIEADALKRLILPLGGMTKSQVKGVAKGLGLSAFIHEESQDICFFKGDYRNFLKQRLPELQREGKIVSLQGKVLGTHGGVGSFTVGQRRGLGIPDATPYYVVEIRADENVVVVGKERDLLRRTFEVQDINWIVEPRILSSMACRVKIRSRHVAAPATLEPLDRAYSRVKVSFETPQKAVTPGQFAVFYKGKAVLGGGRICG